MIEYVVTARLSHACGSEVRLQRRCGQPAHTLCGKRNEQEPLWVSTEALSLPAEGGEAAAANLLVNDKKRSSKVEEETSVAEEVST